MSKLLRANFTRLWKNKVFRGCMIFMFLDALSTIVSMYDNYKRYDIVLLENIALGQTIAAAVITAVFIGLFIGTEHGNGTLRNKLAVGHTRTAVYFANLAVCVFVSLMIHLIYFCTTLLGGVIMFDNFITAPEAFWVKFAVSLIVVAAYAAMFLPVSMLVASKASGSTAVILASFILVIFAMVISQTLNEIDGIKHDIYKALYDILPTCQATRIQLDDMPENPAVIPLWSAAVIAVTTGFGTVLFRRKDLK